MDNMEILGQQIVSEMIGADSKGFDSGFLINAAAELANRGVNTYQEKQAADKIKDDTKKAISADASWANAEVQADLASQGSDQQKKVTMRALADIAAHDADAAGAKLPPDAQAERCKAASDAAKLAAENSASNTSDATKAAKMRAWQKVAAKCSAQAASSGVSPSALAEISRGGRGGEPSFFTKQHAGVPMWGWMVGGTVVLTGGILLIRAMRKK